MRNRCQAKTMLCSISGSTLRRPAKDQGHRLDTLATFGQEQSPKISQGMLSALASSKAGGETPVQPLQPCRRCAVRSYP